MNGDGLIYKSESNFQNIVDEQEEKYINKSKNNSLNFYPTKEGKKKLKTRYYICSSCHSSPKIIFICNNLLHIKCDCIKYINISLRCPCNSERKSPRDSVKKIRQSNYNNEIGITPKKTFFNNSSEKSIVLRFPKKKRQITNILTIKKNTKLDKISLLDKLEKYPKDSRSPKNYENPKRLILKEFIYGKQIGKDFGIYK